MSKPTPDAPPTHSNSERPARRCLLGLPIDALTMPETIAWIESHARDRRAATLSGAPPPPALHIVTLNPEMVMTSRRNESLRAAIRAADLVVADGVGIILAARLLGSPLPARVTGIDLLEALTQQATNTHLRIFLLGAAPGVAKRAARRLTSVAASHCIVGTFAGSPSPADAEATLTAIAAAKPEVVFVGFGSPAQEQWIAVHRSQLAAAVAIGVGGALDFAANVVPRAPRWMRELGLEWLYRLWRQPWRWRRMMALPRFGALTLMQAARERGGRRPVRRGRDT